MSFARKAKKAIIVCVMIIVLLLKLLFVDMTVNSGIIRVVFQPYGGLSYPLSVMSIHPDGRVITRFGEGVVLLGVPFFTESPQRIETFISHDCYNFIKSIITKRERPNLRSDTSNRRNTNVIGGWLLRVSTATRRYNFFGECPVNYATVIREFTLKLYEINPFDLGHPR